jgi:prepilin-type N-terminal cleavage/methylation domain-containing protein
MKAQRGFSLVEMVIAITILGIFMLGLAKANYSIARRFYKLSAGAPRDAEIMAQVNEFNALPFDSLSGRAGTTTFSSLPWSYTRRVTVTAKTTSLDSVMIVFTSLNTNFPSDTEVLMRSKAGSTPLQKH